jgi:hypothetical protein
MSCTLHASEEKSVPGVNFASLLSLNKMVPRTLLQPALRKVMMSDNAIEMRLLIKFGT